MYHLARSSANSTGVMTNTARPMCIVTRYTLSRATVVILITTTRDAIASLWPLCRETNCSSGRDHRSIVERPDREEKPERMKDDSTVSEEMESVLGRRGAIQTGCYI